MTANNQNNLERLLDQRDQGKITVDDANVQLVLQERFRVVHKLPASVQGAKCSRERWPIGTHEEGRHQTGSLLPSYI